MGMTKAFIWGPHNVDSPATGKTELAKALADTNRKFNPEYEPSLGVSFYFRLLDLGYATKTKLDSKVAIWDISGRPDHRNMFSLSAMQSDVLLYCVDLTKPIDEPQLRDAITLFKELNPKGKVILVGTKYDHPDVSEKDFDEIKEKNLGIDFTVLTSAKTRFGLVQLLAYLTMLAKTLNPKTANQEEIESDFEAAKSLNPKETAPKEESSNLEFEPPMIQTHPTRHNTVFPSSYKNMWDTAKTKVANKGEAEQKFESALALLKDYCKTESYNESSLYSSVKRFFTSHMFRNHVTTVRAIVTRFDNPDFKGKKTVENLLEALKTALEDKLVESKKAINPIGSLARRIDFIQQETFGLNTSQDVINIGALNEKIEGPKTPTTPTTPTSSI